VRDLLTEATRRLAAAGVASPRVDAELLLACVTNVPRSRLALLDTIAAPDADRLRRAVDRRAAREPLQHITGRAPFRHLDLLVGSGVFVPRPETELLVDAIAPVAGRVVDLCAGSGALALAIAAECPGTEVWAVERSAAALSWLARNVARTPAGERVHVVAGDVTDAGLLADLHGTVAAVVSNPPYVPTCTPVTPEVRADPADAVFAGQDGLALWPHVVTRAAELLRADGVLAIEHDDTHALAAPGLVEADGRFTDVAEHRDLTGTPRYVTARRR
jgi:release factor glutamine methyltransferase